MEDNSQQDSNPSKSDEEVQKLEELEHQMGIRPPATPAGPAQATIEAQEAARQQEINSKKQLLDAEKNQLKAGQQAQKTYEDVGKNTKGLKALFVFCIVIEILLIGSIIYLIRHAKHATASTDFMLAVFAVLGIGNIFAAVNALKNARNLNARLKQDQVNTQAQIEADKENIERGQ